MTYYNEGKSLEQVNEFIGRTTNCSTVNPQMPIILGLWFESRQDIFFIFTVKFGPTVVKSYVSFKRTKINKKLPGLAWPHFNRKIHLCK